MKPRSSPAAEWHRRVTSVTPGAKTVRVTLVTRISHSDVVSGGGGG